MKLNVAAILIFILLLTQAGFAKETDQAKNQPVLQILESTYKFESITEGKEILHDFTIKNTGDALLEVLRVRPG